MRHKSLLVLTLALCDVSAAAKPQITAKIGVRNLTAVSEPQTIARGSVFVVTGKELGPAEESKAEIPYTAKVADRNVGILTVDGQVGSGAASKILVPESDPVTAGFTQPLRPGQTVELEAAGLGSNEMPDNEPMGHDAGGRRAGLGQSGNPHHLHRPQSVEARI